MIDREQLAVVIYEMNRGWAREGAEHERAFAFAARVPARVQREIDPPRAHLADEHLYEQHHCRFPAIGIERDRLREQLATERMRFVCEADGHQCRFPAMERDLAALRQQLREQIETSEKERTELREQVRILVRWLCDSLVCTGPTP